MRVRCIRWLFALAGLPCTAWAQRSDGTDPLNFSSLIQMLGGLVVVLLILGGCMLVLRRTMGLRTTGGKRLHIVEAVSIGPRDRLVLLDVDGQRLLLGISPGRIQPLLELHDTPRFDRELEASVTGLEQAAS